MKCPEGHEMKRKHGGGLTECPNNVDAEGKCFEFEKCQFNHDVKNCFWCLECGKHYFRDKETVMFT